MNETLTCSSCSKVWKRERSRGRKPMFCPKCVALQNVPLKEPKSKSSKIVALPIPKQVSDLQDPNDPPLTVSKVLSILHPKPSNYKDLLEDTKNGSTWKCSNCSSILKLEIPISDIPTHRCTPNMVSVKLYERIK